MNLLNNYLFQWSIYFFETKSYVYFSESFFKWSVTVSPILNVSFIIFWSIILC